MLCASAAARIRPAERDEAKLLAILGRAAFVESLEEGAEPANLEAYLTAHYGLTIQEAELGNRATRAYFAEVDGVPVGYALMRGGPAPHGVPGSSPLQVGRLYVRRAHWGKGVGELLMAICLMEGRRMECDSLWLSVDERNVRALRFFGHWNFQEVGSEPMGCGPDPQHCRLMALDLDQPPVASSLGPA